MSSIGKDAYCGTLNCDTLIANNTIDPHKITGDLEITGDLKVDGGIEVDSAGFKGLILKSNPSVNQVNISMNENTNTWDISADASSSALFIGHTVNGAGSGSIVASFDKTVGGFGAQLPANPLQLQSIPTSAVGLPSSSVWSNGGVLNITPP
jgi:hypothetical protein